MPFCGSLHPAGGWNRRPVNPPTIQKKRAGLESFASVVHEELQRVARGRMAPQAYGGILTIFAQDVEDHRDIAQSLHIVVVIANNALESFKSCLLRRHSTPHVLDDGVCAGDLDVLLSTAGCAGRAYILIAIAAGADDG